MKVIEAAEIVSGIRPAANETYKIGDTGLGGGIIFFDRGFTGDGWRYLEAAPAGAETNLQWGAFGKNVNGTQTGIGFGRNNTEIIVEYLNHTGETDRAAQYCASLDINGYKDWFLPGKDELNLMYKNLKEKALGGFSNVWYWSSSESNTNYSWYQYFSAGSQYDFFKDTVSRVRPVRAF